MGGMGMKLRQVWWSVLVSVGAGFLMVHVAQGQSTVAPQDAYYYDGGFNFGVAGQSVQYALNRIYYRYQDSGHRIAARDLDGDLIFDATLGAGTHHDFAVGPSGELYFIWTQTGGTQIRQYDEPGQHVRIFGPDGTVDTVFSTSNPKIRVSAATGRVYFMPLSDLGGGHSDYDDNNVNGLIYVFEGNGTFVKTIDTNGILAASLENGGARTFEIGTTEDGIEQLWVRARTGFMKVFSIDGVFDRAMSYTGDSRFVVHKGILYRPGGSSNANLVFSNLSDLGQELSRYRALNFFHQGTAGEKRFLGYSDDGRLVLWWRDQNIIFLYSPTYRTLDLHTRNAVPNAMVFSVEQRDGTGILDIRYRVDDPDNETVKTAMLALTGGASSLLNVVEMETFPDGTAGVLGDGVAVGQVHALAWDAATDWSVDFGTVSVLVLARDDRPYWFDTHLVEIPADGDRPAVTITRNPLEEHDFQMQWMWLVATKDPSISFVDGIVFGVGGDWDAVQLTDANGSTNPDGRAFLLARDGLRVATAAELTRAKQGATPGNIIQQTTFARMHSQPATARAVMPYRINEYGIESFDSSTSGYDYRSTSGNLWYAVVDQD